MLILTQTSKGFPIPRHFVESVLVKDGFTVISEPSMYKPNQFVVIMDNGGAETAVIIEKPMDFHTVKASNSYRKTWLSYPDTRELIANQEF